MIDFQRHSNNLTGALSAHLSDQVVYWLRWFRTVLVALALVLSGIVTVLTLGQQLIDLLLG